ncbi:hypothetical protein D1872_291670 [compost metagenome]
MDHADLLRGGRSYLHFFRLYESGGVQPELSQSKDPVVMGHSGHGLCYSAGHLPCPHRLSWDSGGGRPCLQLVLHGGFNPDGTFYYRAGTVPVLYHLFVAFPVQYVHSLACRAGTV